MVNGKGKGDDVIVSEIAFHLSDDGPLFVVDGFEGFLFVERIFILRIILKEVFAFVFEDPEPKIVVLILLVFIFINDEICSGEILDSFLNVNGPILSTRQEELVVLVILDMSD